MVELSLPKLYYEWLKEARQRPMFDVRRGGVLYQVRLIYILEPLGLDEERDIFAHWSYTRKKYGMDFLPLGYDAFGNILLWNMKTQEVCFHYKNALTQTLVAPTLDEFIDKLYYRPLH
ncbi:MAG: hypothetical protein ACUVRD_03615 [Bacteroidia bacterium]